MTATATASRAHEAARSLVAPVNRVLLAMTAAKLERENVDAIKRRILADQVYAVRDHEGKQYRLTEPREDWLLGDSDWKAYYARVCGEFQRAGYLNLGEFCPALVAEEQQRRMERALVTAAEEYFPGVTVDKLLTMKNGLEKYRQFIDLVIKLVVNHPDYKPIRFPRSVRELHDMDEPQRVVIVTNAGRIIAKTGTIDGSAWYQLGPAVWFVQSATQCQYCGEAATWKVPQYALPA